MPLDEIPEVPPSPRQYSINLYSLPEVLYSVHDREHVTEGIGTEGALPILDESQRSLGMSPGVDVSPIPECSPIPTRHEVVLYSFSDLSRPVPEMDAGSQRVEVMLKSEETNDQTLVPADEAEPDETVGNRGRATSLAQDVRPDKLTQLIDLANFFQSRFERTGMLSDLEEAIKNRRQALLLIPDDHPVKPRWLDNLGTCFHSRFEHTGMLSDLEEAIEDQRQALSLTPDDHPSKPRLLNSLGNSFHSRFRRTGMTRDLEEAIENQRQAVLLTPDDHPAKPERLDSLGTCLHSRFEHTGVLSDLEEAIKNQQQAVLLTSDDQSSKPRLLNSLGGSFLSRFQRIGMPSDLEGAIENQWQAVSLTPNGHPAKPERLNNLGTCFRSRFEYTGVLNDLEEAIKNQGEAVLLTTDGHPSKPRWFNNLGNSFHSRFRHTGSLSDLEEAIANQRQAVLFTPNDHPAKPERLNSLGVPLHNRFERVGTFDDLEEAIKNQRQAVSLTPNGHPSRPRRLNNLGNSLRSLFEHTKSPNDLAEAILPFQLASISNIGPPLPRFQAARWWARLEAKRDPPSALVAYRRAIDLIPQVAWIGDPITKRHLQINSLGDIPREAAAFALDVGMPDLALEWLEQGRSVVWNQLFSLRTSVVDLRQAHPDIYVEFAQVSNELQGAVIGEQLVELSTDVTTTPEESTLHHYSLAEKWNSLVGRIRLVPGFEDFLLPKKVSVLKKAADSGPVVVINVHQRRCDALVLEPGRNEVRHLPLDKLRYEDVEKMRESLGEYLADPHSARREELADAPVTTSGSRIAGILEMLYSSTVYPILQGLDLRAGVSDALHLPRIWWCPTGPLMFLPLHAAGREIPGGRDETSSYVVSSYIPTVNALLEARAVKPQPFDKLVGIAMINPPGSMPLLGAEIELTEIEKLFPPDSRWRFEAIRDEQATVERVLASMAKGSWMHFACPATQDVQEPTRSGLQLHDRRLMVTDIIAKPFATADFAFLSACETAKGDEKTSDEAVHITGAMLGAGYRGIIGTMWSIPDEVAPFVAEKVYRYLLSGEDPNSEQAARALHEGVKELRMSGQDSFYSWVPFVHYGV